MTAPDRSNDSTVHSGGTSDVDTLAAQAGGRTPFREILLGMVWDVVPSIAAYYACRALGASPYVSLLAGTLVAGIGLAFLGSCFVGRPLIFHAARRFSARTEAARAYVRGPVGSILLTWNMWYIKRVGVRARRAVGLAAQPHTAATNAPDSGAAQGAGT